MTTKEYILKANERMIDSYLMGDYRKMDLYRILLNNLIDEEIKKRSKEYETK
jgi:hypothetical protein